MSLEPRDPNLSKHDNAPLRVLHRALILNPVNTFAMNWTSITAPNPPLPPAK